MDAALDAALVASAARAAAEAAVAGSATDPVLLDPAGRPPSAVAAAAVESKSAPHRPDYGTGGFRGPGSDLRTTAWRCGAAAALASAAAHGAPTGLVVTASHNPPGDNGIKLACPLGGMLPVSIESSLTRAAAATTEAELSSALADVGASAADAPALARHRRGGPGSASSRVLVARDTRDTSPGLAALAAAGVRAAGGVVVGLGPSAAQRGAPGGEPEAPLPTPTPQTCPTEAPRDSSEEIKGCPTMRRAARRGREHR